MNIMKVKDCIIQELDCIQGNQLHTTTFQQRTEAAYYEFTFFTMHFSSGLAAVQLCTSSSSSILGKHMEVCFLYEDMLKTLSMGRYWKNLVCSNYSLMQFYTLFGCSYNNNNNIGRNGSF